MRRTGWKAGSLLGRCSLRRQTLSKHTKPLSEKGVKTASEGRSSKPKMQDPTSISGTVKRPA